MAIKQVIVTGSILDFQGVFVPSPVTLRITPSGLMVVGDDANPALLYFVAPEVRTLIVDTNPIQINGTGDPVKFAPNESSSPEDSFYLVEKLGAGDVVEWRGYFRLPDTNTVPISELRPVSPEEAVPANRINSLLSIFGGTLQGTLGLNSGSKIPSDVRDYLSTDLQSFIVYNSVTTLLEFWVNGALVKTLP